MSSGEKRPTERDDAQFIRAMREGYDAPELTAARRRTLDERVWARIERRRRFRWLAGVAASAALATGLVLVVRGGRVATEPSTPPATVASAPAPRMASDSAWADTMLFDPAGDGGTDERLDELPDDYRAITEVLLEG
jgi:hypothetical protein